MITLVAFILLVVVLLCQPWNLPRDHWWYEVSAPITVILIIIVLLGVLTKHMPDLTHVGQWIYRNL